LLASTTTQNGSRTPADAPFHRRFACDLLNHHPTKLRGLLSRYMTSWRKHQQPLPLFSFFFFSQNLGFFIEQRSAAFDKCFKSNMRKRTFFLASEDSLSASDLNAAPVFQFLLCKYLQLFFAF
jgi:hypothetical protein